MALPVSAETTARTELAPPRVSMCSSAQLWEQYVLPGRAVIITDLMEVAPGASKIAALRQTLAPLTDVAFMPAGFGGDARTIASWLDDIESGKAGLGGRNVVVPCDVAERMAGRGADLSPPLRSRFDTSARQAGGGLRAFLGWSEISECHVDGWITESLTFQVAGTKEWFLAPPSACAALVPIAGSVLVDPMLMTLAERCRVAQEIGAFSFTLHAGEILFFPHQWLHGCHYPEPSFAFVEQFGRSVTSLFFAREIPHIHLRHLALQKLHPEATVKSDYWDELVALHDAARVDYATPRDRYCALRDTLQAVCHRLFPHAPDNVKPARAIGDAALEAARSNYTLLYPNGETSRLRAGEHTQLQLEEAIGIDQCTFELEWGRQRWPEITGLPLFDWWR
jgi:hypothetical protein